MTDEKTDETAGAEGTAEEPPVITSTVDETESAETAADDDADTDDVAPKEARRFDAVTVVGLAVLPALALLLAIGAAWLKYYDNQAVASAAAREESMRVAADSTSKLLSYKPDTVEQQLNDARQLLTGEFSTEYADLITNVVIPNATQQLVSAVATVPKTASVSAEPDHAVVLVFVNQTVAVGTNPPTDTASSVRVTLDRVDGKWLISKFNPV